MKRQLARLIILCGIVIISATGLSARTSNSKVAVVVGNNAPDLENFAASELCGYLHKLFGVRGTAHNQTARIVRCDISDRIAGFKSADQVISASQRSRHCDPARCRQNTDLNCRRRQSQGDDVGGVRTG